MSLPTPYLTRVSRALWLHFQDESEKKFAVEGLDTGGPASRGGREAPLHLERRLKPNPRAVEGKPWFELLPPGGEAGRRRGRKVVQII